MACMSMSAHANGSVPVRLADDVTADRSNRMNSEAYRAVVPAQIQPDAPKLIRLHSANG